MVLAQLGVSIIIANEDKVLIAKRSVEKKVGVGLWEFPSGRLEPHETVEECLYREADEELGIKITAHALIDSYTFLRGSQKFLLLNYYCTYTGEIAISPEHEVLKWVDKNKLNDFFIFDLQKRVASRLISIWDYLDKLITKYA